ncbi:G-protein coupled receptor moody isoform X2 [Hyalella azteca]|uniref:G-protein coupled receptor moody isoform X2 n=1 Tax=Hyalella azteca TaxID=294128 RepID=A0A979FLD6_HYAAZ|nr:G-protein coupled receptor moody isoform X2 [Hyalella azteca]
MADITKAMSYLYESGPVFESYPSASQEAGASGDGGETTEFNKSFNATVSLINATDVDDDGMIEAVMGTQFPYHMLGFTAACAFIIAILGAVGNLLTIVALPMSRSLRTTATAFVVNLAVVELLFCVSVLPLSGAQYSYLMLFNTSLLSDSACNYFAVMRYSLTQIELQTILAIALMRAVAVSCMNLYRKINTPVVVGVYIAIIWVYSFALKIPTAMGKFGHYSYNNLTMECDMGNDRASLVARKWIIRIEAIAPIFIIVILYVFIFVMLMRRCRKRIRRLQKRNSSFGASKAQPAAVKLSSRRVSRATAKKRAPPPDKATGVEQDPEPQQEEKEDPAEDGPLKSPRRLSSASFKGLKRMVSDKSFRATFARRSSNLSQKLSTSRRDMRVARTIFIIFVLIMVCSVPVMVVHAKDPTVKDPNRFLIVHILYWVQYCVNVLIYVLMNRQYRDAYLEVLSKLVPSWRRHKGYMFPWETPSTTSKPTVPTNNVSTKSRKGSQKDTSTRRDSDAMSGGLAYPRSGRLSAIPERGSSSVGDESLVLEGQVLPLATPPVDIPRRGSQSSLKTASPPTPLSYDSGNGHFTSMPCSPLGFSGSYSPSESYLENGKTPENKKTANGAHSSMKSLHDKLSAISVEELSPLNDIGETEEVTEGEHQLDSPGIKRKNSYTTINGTSTANIEKADAV